MCLVRSRQRNVGKPILPGARKAMDPSGQFDAEDTKQLVAKNQQRDHGLNRSFGNDALDYEPRPIQESRNFNDFGNSKPMHVPEPIGVSSTSKPLKSITATTALPPTGKGHSKGDNKKGKKNQSVIIVQHNYHDHSMDNEADHQNQQKSRGGVSIPFPLKLHDMLDRAMADGHGSVVSWQPHGRCFVVLKPREFQDTVLPKYFKLTKLSSFQRQLNLYGFQRLTLGRDRGGYYHELFLRNKVFLARDMQRVQVKGTGVRARSNPAQEPNFWTMSWCESKTMAVSSEDESEGSVVPFPTWNKSITQDSRNDELQYTVAVPAINQIQSITPILHPNTIPSLGQFHNGVPVAYSMMNSKQHILSNVNVRDTDLVFSFGDKTFHYLDPFQPISLHENKNRTNINNNKNGVTDMDAEFLEHLFFSHGR
mmetsp:Transcript_20509/g.46544  ORF Transcript_20509/g.46544 Transcript_20509/m.46544 type:complete len:423 (-) Transcript_20509:142-1410(-)|eukprot:CAMPEP_0201163898 /NCGR_PEP_ID=MMETSP0851-20130426/58595_1 /ASSEMBLY_ACC=CAM_ASM_000631 /TAXON_ID=183588 /ORGANISM="Pseudo-nitzschia fraudulenta, Strain WWA7" /LENGTH=422 /DNA_ID=CAMNT_0047444191 /DNA_START=107 /DNA_END=1375 /DNA_ORIENTATION=-